MTLASLCLNKRSVTLLLFFILNPLFFTQNSLPWQERSFSPVKDSLILTAGDNFSVPSGGNLSDEEYIVGPGDRFLVSIIGIEEITYTPVIDYENNLYIPGLGAVNLRDASLRSAKAILDSLIRKNFRQVKTFIGLSEIRKVKVQIAGSVKNPGGLVLFANSRLSDIISSGKFLEETADIRNIQVTSSEKTVKRFDLLKFFRLGELNQNPYVREGDFIFIPRFDKHVTLNGSVAYPGVYEFVGEESLADLVKLSGGFTSDARKDTIELIRFDENGKKQFSKYIDIQKDNLGSIILRDRDRILVRKDPTLYEDHIVIVEGYVKYPGYYRIEKNVTKLSEIVKLAGGLLPEASLVDASLYRNIRNESIDPEFERIKMIPRADMTEDEYDYYKSKSRERKGRLVVDFVSLLEKGDTGEDILLMRNDRIEFPRKKNYITIIGQVVNPGKLEFKSGYAISDYIRLAGGFGWRALDDEVRVVKAATGEWVDADDLEELQPGDIIWVPEDPPAPPFWTVFKDTLSILGQVATVVAATVAVVVSVR